MTFLEWLSNENNQGFAIVSLVFTGIFILVAIAIWRSR